MKYFILFCAALLTYMGTEAQIYNTGVLYVGSGNILSSGGDFTNTAGASYQNDGSVYINGNASNSQTSLPAGAGTTWFNGLAAQTLSGSAPFRCFNMVLDNAAGLTLGNRLAIGDGTGGTLTFTAGLIHSGTNAQDVYFYPGSGYTGFDAGHHIIGYTTKNGNSNFTFPIGDGIHKADLDLSNLSASADFQVLYNGTGYGTYNSNISLAPGGVFTNEWWDLGPTAGAATGTVTLKWDDTRKALNHSQPASLVIAHFTGGAWQSEGGSSADPAGNSTGTVGPSNTVSSFSPFTFGSTSVPLPILLNSLTGVEKDCKAWLEWSTALEENARGFEIQQSVDGINYTTVDFVKAKGIPSSYQLSVPQSVPQALYRIGEEDLDGSLTYSVVVRVNLDCIANAETVSVYPNPVPAGGNMEVRLIVPAARGTAQMQVVDMSGKIIYTHMLSVNGGLNLYTIPSSGLAKGIYTLFIIGDGWKTGGVQVLKNE
ncbi:MAG TPA: T9SS type A sorting domain-containing protein [Puia sp.]|nr:T9SS type A sorting domain-containing protein [Puia sp.]